MIDRLIYGDRDLVRHADSIDALAKPSGLQDDALKATVDHFNAMIKEGDGYRVSAFHEGWKHASKDRGAAVLCRAAFPFHSKEHGRSTNGSLLSGCRVVDRDGKPIPGLYAAGEFSGFAAIKGTSPLESTFLGPYVVTGRVAGRTASREAQLQASMNECATVRSRGERASSRCNCEVLVHRLPLSEIAHLTESRWLHSL